LDAPSALEVTPFFHERGVSGAVARQGTVRETELVPDYCTCGAQLVPEARFCHKCGKPQFDWHPPEAPSEKPPQQVEPAPTEADISFRNRTAVRIGLAMAALASVLISLPMPMYVNVIWMLMWLVAAGFLAVYFYERRTGQGLSVRKGARMGWITGVFCFAIATIFFTITMVAISRRGGLAQFYLEQLGAQGGRSADVEQLLEMLEQPAGAATLVFLTLLLLFFLFTLLPTLGGAMGAKLLAREPAR